MKKNIIWIASYPKSGNTWFRAFLTALFQNGKVDINDLYTKHIYSSKLIFEHETDLDPNLLYQSESKKLIPTIFGQLSDSNKTNEPLFVKIHDKFQILENGLPFLPLEQTKCIIYIIRNPLDVSISLAKHMGLSIDQTVDFLNDRESQLVSQKNNLNIKQQFPQHLGSWSDHVESWCEQNLFPILLIRYEDLIHQPKLYFEKAIKFMGLDFPEVSIINAINESSFEKLQEQERKKSFKENPNTNQPFFNSGKTANWKNHLTKTQTNSIIMNHSNTMQKFNYIE